MARAFQRSTSTCSSYGSIAICVLQTPYYLARHTIRQTMDIALLFTDTGEELVLYLLDLPLSKWSWKVTRGRA
jgi:hypothetical protein